MKKLFNIFHNYSLITLLILVITGCSNKVYEFRVNETSKQISNDELSKMSFDEFYNFMKVRELHMDKVITYSNAYETFDRYCKLRGSELLVYTPDDYYSRINNIEPILKEYDRYYDGSTYYGCKLYDTKEYMELVRIASHGYSGLIFGKPVRDDTYLLERNVIDKTFYNIYLKKFREIKDAKYSNPKEYSSFKKAIDSLRDRKGSYEAFYFSGYIDEKGKSNSILDDDIDRSAYHNTSHLYKQYEACEYKCKKINIQNNGYDILKDSIRDNWTVESKIDTYINKKIDSSCTCFGDVKYIMKK